MGSQENSRQEKHIPKGLSSPDRVREWMVFLICRDAQQNPKSYAQIKNHQKSCKFCQWEVKYRIKELEYWKSIPLGT